MSSFALLIASFLYFQGCVMQNVFGQCLGDFPVNFGAGNYECGFGRGYGFPNSLSSGCGLNVGEVVGAYGGAGTGDLEVAGGLPVAGSTVVTGEVPIIGTVQFTGDVPAGGVVSIVGKCGCDCNGAPLF